MNKEHWQLFYVWLIPALWAIWWGYWLVFFRKVRSEDKRESSISRGIHLALVCGAFALIAIPVFGAGPLGWHWLPRLRFVFLSGAALLAASLLLAVWARRHLGQYWSGMIAVKGAHQLVRSGPYYFVRHPIYTGFVGGMIGTAISLGELRGVLAVFVLTFAYLRKIRIEEKWLVESLGQTYLDYQKEVKALIPFVI